MSADNESVKRILFAIGALILAAILVVVSVGWLAPRDHVASSRATYAKSPAEVWAVLADFEGWSAWNSAFDAVERGDDRGGRPYWIFTGGWGPLPFVIEESDPPLRMRSRIPEDAELGFHGTWTYELAPNGAGTTLTLTESGTTTSLLFRAIGTLFMDNHTTMNAFLADLGEHFGEEVEVEEVR